jgi:hypothetical protein
LFGLIVKARPVHPRVLRCADIFGAARHNTPCILFEFSNQNRKISHPGALRKRR